MNIADDLTLDENMDVNGLPENDQNVSSGVDFTESQSINEYNQKKEL